MLAGAALPLLAGSVAGIVAVLVSQPADVAFTLTTSATMHGAGGRAAAAGEGGGGGAEQGLARAIASLRADPSLALNGIGPRLLFGSLLVSIQFVLFSECRDLLGVSRDDLTYYWDALSVLR